MSMNRRRMMTQLGVAVATTWFATGEAMAGWCHRRRVSGCGLFSHRRARFQGSIYGNCNEPLKISRTSFEDSPATYVNGNSYTISIYRGLNSAVFNSTKVMGVSIYESDTRITWNVTSYSFINDDQIDATATVTVPQGTSINSYQLTVTVQSSIKTDCNATHPFPFTPGSGNGIMYSS